MGRLSDVSTTLDPYIIEHLMKHEVPFYHSDNIEQVLAHCQNNRLLTRRELIDLDPTGKTGFYSDDIDTSIGFDDRVFGNPHDLGKIFVRGGYNCSPYIYGPIVFEFKPNTYSLMSDIIITAKSVGTLKHRWREQQVLTEATVDLILQGHAPTDDLIHWDWQGCELNCAKHVIPLTYLSSVIVEPITVEGWPLHRLVSTILGKHNIKVDVIERPYRPNNPLSLGIIGGLSAFCHALPADITEAQWGEQVPPFPESLGNLTDSQKTRFRLWCRYFYFGSLKLTRARVAAMKK